MAKFLAATDINGERVWVNVDHIETIIRINYSDDDGGAAIQFINGDSLSLKETPESVTNRIKCL